MNTSSNPLPVNTLYAHCESTPVGRLLTLVEEQGALIALRFCDEADAAQIAAQFARPGETVIWSEAKNAPVWEQLRAYFTGQRTDFDLPLTLRGTPFQQRIWAELRRVPYGTTVTYGELARRVGSPNASRAVGGANGANPIAIVVPCHRVIGADRSLTGYAWGTGRKSLLLALEQQGPQGGQPAPSVAQGTRQPALF